MNTETLLLLNSILTTSAGALFLVMGYFLRDLHKDFKALIERVNELSTQLATHVATTKQKTDDLQRLRQRIDAIEARFPKL